jgi:flagellar hook-associated protein 1 FlgK
VEQSVWRQQNSTGQFTQESQSLSPIEQIIGVTVDASIPSGMDQLFNSFSALATAPNDLVLRQNVLDNASQLANSFRTASSDLAAQSADTNRQVSNTVDQINQIVGQVLEYNQAVGAGAASRQDAGADAKAYAALENLSQLVDFTAFRGSNGEFEIRLGVGQSPLLLSSQQFPLKADFSGAQTRIRNQSGESIASQVQSGKLASLLDVTNNLLPLFSADIDSLAEGLADQVNAALANGVDANGKPGKDLFAYDAGAPASTLSVTAMAASGLAAATVAAPGGGGNAASVAALAAQKLLDGGTFSQFYGGLAGRIGQRKASADQDQQLHQQLLAQAQSVREETSGVSLDEEATRLIQFQRAYQASAQLLSVLNQLTGTVINILQG